MNSISAEAWLRIEPILDQALDQAPADREAFLDRACADDPVLRREVERLLAASQEPPAFLEGAKP